MSSNLHSARVVLSPIKHKHLAIPHDRPGIKGVQHFPVHWPLQNRIDKAGLRPRSNHRIPASRPRKRSNFPLRRVLRVQSAGTQQRHCKPELSSYVHEPSIFGYPRRSRGDGRLARPGGAKLRSALGMRRALRAADEPDVTRPPSSNAGSQPLRRFPASRNMTPSRLSGGSSARSPTLPHCYFGARRSRSTR